MFRNNITILLIIILILSPLASNIAYSNSSTSNSNNVDKEECDIKIAIYAIADYPADHPDTPQVKDAVATFIKVLLGKDWSWDTGPSKVDGKVGTTKICIYIFKDKEVTSDTIYNVKSAWFGHYDIMIFLGHGQDYQKAREYNLRNYGVEAAGGILVYDSSLKKSTYISLFQMHIRHNKDVRLKWMFLYACYSTDIFALGGTLSGLTKISQEKIKKVLDEIAYQTFQVKSIKDLKDIRLFGISGFFTEACMSCAFGFSNAAKDFMEKFAKYLKENYVLPVAWAKPNVEENKGGCSPIFRAYTASIYFKIIAIRGSSVHDFDSRFITLSSLPIIYQGFQSFYNLYVASGKYNVEFKLYYSIPLENWKKMILKVDDVCYEKRDSHGITLLIPKPKHGGGYPYTKFKLFVMF